ncbi:hypothetical protein A3D07_02700 [Candidatus Curtissbacteria bacterium RIFCSPHIGHO2_02_FULL_42_15]|uniref:Lipoprotein n=1 Tax=Candidatus Curtissbacteria bacterium RIFCSPHIGHO2_02_FULL_42_15 TaxID=1797716 RepID=A0A1F5GIV7_9BACT|nr:MAG: hypothetical protein A3D07_02700 [Candidatus Curtissbacteria bacterium RIFCSPHIGHO2_02_FULL_42_15]
MERSELKKPVTQEIFPRAAIVGVILVGAIVAGCRSEVGNNQTPATTQDNTTVTETVKAAPTFEQIQAQIFDAYKTVGKEAPRSVTEALSACVEDLSPGTDIEPVSYAMDRCGSVGDELNAEYQKTKHSVFAEALENMKYFTFDRLEKMVPEDSIFDVEAYERSLEKNNFTLPVGQE